LAQLDGLPPVRQQCDIFSGTRLFSEMVALSMAALKLMMLAGCSCVFVWTFELAVELGFLQFKPIQFPA